MRISIFGTGYVGLVSGVCLANTGKYVYCIDKDEGKINKLKQGISPIYEPKLDKLLKDNFDRIIPTTNTTEAIKNSQVIFIAVGTPFKGRHIDLSYIKQAAKEIGKSIKNSNEYKVVVVKSTVIPETTIKIVKPLVLKSSGKNENEVGFCMNPEFLREGKAVEDFNNPDRIVLGVTSKKVENIMREVYSRFKDVDIIVTNPTTAEMIKYTANSYLALTISFSNEIARICETIEGVDSEEVFNGVILDKRFSPIINDHRIVPQLSTYLRAGIGFGGSCFPKDVKAFEAFSQYKNIDSVLLRGLLHINETQIEHVFNLGINNHKGKVKKITVLGTAFKPDTDDIRESPGIKIVEMALKKGITVTIHDYIALNNTMTLFKDRIKYKDNPIEAMKNADVVFVTTIWNNYLNISDEDFEKTLSKNSIVVDTRSLYKSRMNKAWRIRVGVGK